MADVKEHPAQTHRAWYGNAIARFLSESAETIIGTLATNSDFSILPTQRDAWIGQIRILANALEGISGFVFLEFNIPRMGRRIDAVIVVGAVVVVIEFKVGKEAVERADLEQVWDYALDLKNFHEASHQAPIIPFVIATKAPKGRMTNMICDDDQVYRPVAITGEQLGAKLREAVVNVVGAAINSVKWGAAAYRPTPTIIEAARALYSNHSVEAIARYDAGAANLRLTSRRIDELIEDAMRKRHKVVCFVTGVPGAGKTLVGLNVATHHRRELQKPTHAVYLSGNGPLVAVLREALTRDEVARRRENGEKATKETAGESIKAFIQNIHHFRDEGLKTEDVQSPPFEHVVVFDESQRAWNLQKTASFMAAKRKRLNFSQSEAEFLISYMDRHPDWAFVVCLVGGGQEIHTGEAGIGAWIEAVQDKFPGWRMAISSRLIDSEYGIGARAELLRTAPNSILDDALHLNVSMRSFRSERVSSFVKALLDCEPVEACDQYRKMGGRYPIVLTRDLRVAKQWVREKARGSERFGLLASSKAQRLKPHAIDVRVKVNPVNWFLNGRDDTRSSYYLEDVATEFQVQGLELDWTCVTWDGDLRFNGKGWNCHDFKGSRWCNIHNQDARNYLKNAYRVLLTRARQGMAIFVPQGDLSDRTRNPDFYDATFNYLAGLGIDVVS